MTRLTTYGRPLLPPTYAPAYQAAPAPVVAAEPKMPRLLGVAAACYLASVCFFSTASESLAWVAQAVGVAVGLAWLTLGLVIYGQGVTWTKPITLYVLYMAWGTTGFLVTINREIFVLQWMTMLKVVLITWVMSQCIRTRKDLLVCFLAIATASILVMVLSRDVIMKSVKFQGDDSDSYGQSRAFGTLLGNPNNLGMFGVLVVEAGLFCLMSYKSILFKLVGCLAGVCGLYLVAASGSRTAMLGIGVGAIALYYYHLRKMGSQSLIKKLSIGLIAFMLLAGTAYYISTLPFFFRVKDMVSSRSGVEREPRFRYFVKSLGVVASNPVLGLGWGGFAMHRLGTNARGQGHYSHSSISESLSAGGLIGFLLYYGAHLSLYLQLRRLLKLDLPPKDRTTVNLIMCFLWILIAFSVVAVLFYHRLFWPVMGACSGYAWFLEKQYGHTQLAPEVAYPPYPSRRVALPQQFH